MIGKTCRISIFYCITTEKIYILMHVIGWQADSDTSSAKIWQGHATAKADEYED